MTNIIDQVGYTYIEYNADFHMKYKHYFINRVYDHEDVYAYPLIITWSETNMKVDEETGKCLAIATKHSYYPDNLKISESLFEDILQAFILFPESHDSDEETNIIRLEFVKALLES